MPAPTPSSDANAVTNGRRRTNVEDIQQEILQRICFLDYQPGEQLKEAELAAEFGVSRTPVRDALSRINHLGLVETRNGVGTVVVELTQESVKQVYEMRLHLATLIGTMTPLTIEVHHIRRAQHLLKRAHCLTGDFDSRDYVRLNHNLNDLIADLIGNAVLRSFWSQTYYQTASTWHRVAKRLGAGVARSLVDELTDLNTALAEKDLTALGYVQRIHIGYGYQRVLKVLYQ